MKHTGQAVPNEDGTYKKECSRHCQKEKCSCDETTMCSICSEIDLENSAWCKGHGKKKRCGRCLVFYKKKEEMVGKVCEVKNIYGSDYQVWTPDKYDWWHFPHSALSYPIDEVEDSAAQEAIALLEKNGYVISKK